MHLKSSLRLIFNFALSCDIRRAREEVVKRRDVILDKKGESIKICSNACCFFFYKPVNIIVDLIVAGECQKDPKAWPQRKENLRCGVYPHLHWNNRMSIT